MEVVATMTIRLPLIKPDGHCEIILRNCQYVPASRCSLISLGKLEEAPLNFDWRRVDSGIILMSEGDREVRFAAKQNGLFHLRIQ